MTTEKKTNHRTTNVNVNAAAMSTGGGAGSAKTANKTYVIQGLGAEGQAMVGIKPAKAKKKLHRGVLIGVIVAIVAIAVALSVWLIAGGGSSILDPNAQEGQAPYKTQAEIQEELNRQVEEGMFNISIVSSIDFDDGQSEGQAFIENVPGNRYNMRVVITDDNNSDKVYYESGVIKPNQYIENIRLTEDLEPGEYPCTATFTATDTETNEEIGQAAAKITLNVLG